MSVSTATQVPKHRLHELTVPIRKQISSHLDMPDFLCLVGTGKAFSVETILPEGSQVRFSWSLDLDENKKWKRIYEKIGDCIKTVDCSHSPNVSPILGNLSLYCPNLRRLNLSHCRKIDLACLDACLETLRLESLDLSYTRIPLMRDRTLFPLLKALVSCKSKETLRELNLQGLSFSIEDFSLLNQLSLRKLNLDFANDLSGGGNRFAEVLKSFTEGAIQKTLRELSMVQHHFLPLQTESIRFLSKLPLQVLHVSHFHGEGTEFQHFINGAIKDTLQSISLRSSTVTSATLQSLCPLALTSLD